MSKLNNLNVESALAPFKTSLGKDFPKIVSDIKSLLGRVNKDIVAKMGNWKAGATFKLTSKEGYTVQLPANNPASILLCFGMRMNDLSNSAGCEIVATIPKSCEAWVEHKRTLLDGQNQPEQGDEDTNSPGTTKELAKPAAK